MSDQEISHPAVSSQQYSGVLQVNLAAVGRNWQQLASAFCGAHCGAVVKANAYGLGLAPVSQRLYEVGCRSYFVANFLEGRDLRATLPAPAQIYVLQGCVPGMESSFVDLNLRPVLHTLGMYQRWQDVAGGALAALKVNTGMNRLGLSLAEFDQVCVDEKRLKTSGVRLVMSHLACADEPQHELNDVQLRRFSVCVRQLRRLLPDVQASLVNSAGIELGKDWHFDVARPGIAIYGCGVSEASLHSVVELKLPVLQVRDVEAGESVGYGASFIAPKKMKIALLAGGYADGVVRHLSNTGRVWFGRFLPVVGIVSMDSVAVDLSPLRADELPQEGSLVELLGEHCSAGALADQAGTISYELLTGLGDRLSLEYVT